MVYSFQCSCGYEKDFKCSIKEHSLLKDKMECDRCGQVMVQKVEAPNFRLGGSGWYRDNYSSGVDTQADLDRELRINDSINNKTAQGKYEMEI